jgi:hypothetical protein
MNDIPGIDLKIDEARGKVSGTIVFYYQERSNLRTSSRMQNAFSSKKKT